MIQGQVFQDVAPAFPGLANWSVDLSGPVSAVALTDAAGNYTFSGLPAGTYTICEELQTGWHQTFPTSGAACPGGLGYSFTIGVGGTAQFNDFGNVTP